MCSCVLEMWRRYWSICEVIHQYISGTVGPPESARERRPPVPIGPDRSRYGGAHLTVFTRLVRLRSRQRRAISRVWSPRRPPSNLTSLHGCGQIRHPRAIFRRKDCDVYSVLPRARRTLSNANTMREKKKLLEPESARVTTWPYDNTMEILKGIGKACRNVFIDEGIDSYRVQIFLI